MGFMAYLHCRMRTPNPMATLHSAEVCTLHEVRFRFQSLLPTTGTGLESEPVPESVSRNVNEPLCRVGFRINYLPPESVNRKGIFIICVHFTFHSYLREAFPGPV